MALTAGIIGLPNVGKSTLFNAITKSQVEAANYPFATIEPNVGVVKVIDERVKRLSKLLKPKTTTFTTFTFTDIAGLVKGASKGEGLGNKFLDNIKNVDAICHVVRCFEDSKITHIENTIDPLRDVEIINLELIIKDESILTNSIQKIEKKSLTTNDDTLKKQVQIYKKAFNHIKTGKLLNSLALEKEEHLILQALNLITIKPVIFVANVPEQDINKKEVNQHYKVLKNYAAKVNSPVIAISAKIEYEISLLDDEDKKTFMAEYNMSKSGLDKLTYATYKLLDLQTFLTAGLKEVKAWTFKRGFSASQCAGLIHSDFERGFIRAEVIKYVDYIKYGSETKVKEAGKLSSEGKDYLMQDGDVVLFRFNV